MKLPKHIEVRRGGRIAKILIDGVELDTAISTKADVNVDVADCPSVTITLMAEVVSVTDSLDPLPDLYPEDAA